MALPNPWYIDAQARHLALTQRLLAYSAVEGQEGVLNWDHLQVVDSDTPDGNIGVMPGAYSILARHLGGAFEAYLGKVQQKEVVAVSPTTSAGSRTDLVILRVENPYVSGSGSWAEPPDPVNGPYASVRVIEGVPANTNHISAYNNTWSAITLARITRPASTGVVLQSHITDLRSLAKLGGQRIIIIESPPVDPPPIAQQYWTESTPCTDSYQMPSTQTSYVNFPDDANWQVPVPDWATGFDVNVVLNPQATNHLTGEMRLVINNGGITNDACGIIPAMYDHNFKTDPVGGPERFLHLVGGTGSLQKAHRGKVVNMRLQARSLDSVNVTGKLGQAAGTRVNIWLNFKRNPSYDP